MRKIFLLIVLLPIYGCSKVDPSVCIDQGAKDKIGSMIAPMAKQLGDSAIEVAESKGFQFADGAKTDFNIDGFIVKSIDKDSGSSECAFNLFVDVAYEKDKHLKSEGLVRFNTFLSDKGRAYSIVKQDIPPIILGIHE